MKQNAKTKGEEELDKLLYPGKIQSERERNRALLEGYKYKKYVEAITGFAAQDMQNIAFLRKSSAIRVRIGARGNYKAGMTVMSDGTLIVGTCKMRKVGSQPVFNIHVFRSKDGGITWECVNKTPLYGKEPCLACLPDDTLIMTSQIAGIYDKNSPGMPVYRSVDGGITWDVNHIPGNRDYPRSMIVQTDGSITIVRAKDFKYWFENREGGSPNLEIARSMDNGSTWEFIEGIVDWDFSGFAEVSAIRLKDGRLLAALRRQPYGTEGEAFEDTVLTESQDDGKHWSAPVRISNAGEVHFFLTELSDGRILATYSNYHLPYGVYAVQSTDGGRSWDLENPIQLALSSDIYVGWPVTLQLSDRSLITSYAVTTYLKQKPDTTTCEVVKWKL